ncbi:MAG: hypothetical protein ABI867_28290 [Kofleriaceae bacterium]
MSLIEAESTGPIEGDDALVTPPRPPHRRVSISLVFTMTMLVTTVVGIYLTFPPRNTKLMEEALARHRDATPAYSITSPSPKELRAWAIGVVGKEPPLPNGVVIGGREVEVLGRRAAVIDLSVAGEPVTYLVQYTRVISPGHSDRDDGDLRAVAWRRGEFTIVAVGQESTARTWATALGAK